ncbi:MAG: tRNA (adenosine(37)-N6)-dimethylallyltransferase MiaA [Spirochaetaceae bacterium]|nr:tRNA (adenosine(37)-N6)-dimethylallyltransferase MiaA [Spirochaetaceae bacterium]
MTTSSLPIDAIVLAGPTASGKTDLLDELFGRGADSTLPQLQKRLQCDVQGVDIISADSMQAYRGMDIGTAKPDPDLLHRLPHYLIDIRDPREQYTAGDFVNLADQACASSRAQGRLPIVAGGTGFYVKNFLCGLPGAPRCDPVIRQQVQSDLEARGPEALRKELAEADPHLAASIKPRDLYRLSRAVEILRQTGKPPSLFAPSATIREGRRFLVLGITRPREVLHERINARVEAMFARGLVEEVRSLRARGYSPDDPGMQAIGYREFFELDGRAEEDIKAAVALHTRQYAKRQMTFFRALPGIRWVDPTPEALRAAIFDMLSSLPLLDTGKTHEV